MALTDSDTASASPQDVFERINAPRTEAPAEVVETARASEAETTEAAEQRARDERGRFKAAEEAPIAQEVQTETEGRREAAIPPGRLREEAEARRKAEAALTETRAEMDRRFADYERRLASMQTPPRPVEQPKIPDLIEDPQGYQAFVLQQAERTYRKNRIDETFEDAKDQHGEAFDKAYAALLDARQTGDAAIVQKITNAANPGKALMRWHNEQTALREIGSDLTSYRQRMIDDARKAALEDPEFRKLAMSTWTEQARAAPETRPSNVTDLPSLNSATGRGASSADPGEQGPRGVFERINRR